MIKEHGYLRCLLDHRAAIGYTLSTMEIYSLPKMYDALNLPRGLRMAVVVPEALRRDMNFFETVCRNNGYFVSIFFEYDAAVEWLKR